MPRDPIIEDSLDQLANLIAIAFVVQFLWSYYRNCYRKGYSMDIWHFSLLYNLFIIHIMLPFSRSDLNVFALGPGLLRRTQQHVDEAYFISALGYLGILIGGSLWRVHLGIGLRRTFSRVIELPTRGSLLLLRSRPLLILHGIVAVTILFGVVLYYFKTSGFGFNLRGLLLVTPALRPIAQFAAFYSVLIGSYCLVRFYTYREFSLLSVIGLIMVGLIFFGERGNIIAITTLLISGLFIRLGKRLKLIWIGVGVAATLFLTFLLDAIRRPNFSLKAVVEGFTINMFYGNSFSDTRDFALVLSNWDGHHFWGKTYLAGLFAFIPRALSSFRDTWAIGVVTATMAGFKPTEHPGLRVGIFGEAYFNFGLVAVFLLGLLIGATLRLVDMRMKQSAADSSRSQMRLYSYAVAMAIVSGFENSSSASSIYTVYLIFALSWIVLRCFRFLKIPA